MNLIVAVDKNWAIGRNNKLLVSIPDDMKLSSPLQQTHAKFPFPTQLKEMFCTALHLT